MKSKEVKLFGPIQYKKNLQKSLNDFFRTHNVQHMQIWTENEMWFAYLVSHAATIEL
jgi:hypothetical protein